MSSTARDFDALIKEFYEVWFRFHPTDALEAGVSGYEGGLPAVDDDEVGALSAWLESTIVALEELDYHSLDDARQLDMELLFSACQDELHVILERDWRHRDPAAFLPFQAIHQLVLTPQVELRGALEACLKRIPEYLRHARSQISSFPELVPGPWLEAALLEGEEGIRYLEDLRDSPLVRRVCRNPVKVQDLCDQVVGAVHGYRHFLKQEIAHRAQGVVGCGRDRFGQQLSYRHGLQSGPDRLLQLARKSYERTLAELKSLSLEQTGSEDVDSWMDSLAKRAPVDDDEMLEFARDHSRMMGQFIRDRELFEIPEHTHLKLQHNPGHFRPGICSPSYVAPAIGDPEPTGIIFISEEGSSADGRLPEGVAGQCIRNGWSGRHLQAVSAEASPLAGSLVRRLNPSATLTGGWPLYVEQLMFEQGFSSTPEHSLVRLLVQLHSALLALLDIEIHVHGLDPATALARLERLPGVSQKQAARDLMGLTRNPGNALAGLVGWRMLSELRSLLECQDPGFDLKGFHSRLLEQGAIAAPLLIQRVFGQHSWEAVEASVGLVD